VFSEYDESDDDDEEDYDNEYPDGDSCCSQNEGDREKVVTGLESRMKDKIISLQDQLIKHYFGDQKLSDNDVIRYSAMADVLKSMLV
jgi:hypothetical protein